MRERRRERERKKEDQKRNLSFLMIPPPKLSLSVRGCLPRSEEEGS